MPVSRHHVGMTRVPRSDVWADPRVVVAESPIEGCGLFAAEPVERGAVVLRLGGRLVSSAELTDLIAWADGDPSASYIDTVTIAEDAHLVLPAGTTAHFANHSCNPTLWHVDAFDLATRRDVARGEELTVDYATNSGADGLDLACRCGSSLCRGRITSADWRLSALHDRYRGHWTPALEARIHQHPANDP
jgi:SET domain-containing protein